jgi:hypothetical protein
MKSYHHLPFPYHGKCLDYERSCFELAEILAKQAHRLKSLTLVLPEGAEYAVSDTDELENRVMDSIEELVTAKPFFELRAVRMFDESHIVGGLDRP